MEGGAKILGVFRVKNHDFTPKNHIFSNFREGRAPGAPPPPGSAPVISHEPSKFYGIKTEHMLSVVFQLVNVTLLRKKTGGTC